MNNKYLNLFIATGIICFTLTMLGRIVEDLLHITFINYFISFLIGTGILTAVALFFVIVDELKGGNNGIQK